VQEAAKDELVAWESIDSSWEKDMKKGDTLYIGKTNTVTATEVVVGTKASALNPFNTTATTLSVDQWYEAPVDVDDMSSKQTQIDPEGESAKEGAYAIAVAIDSSVCALFDTLFSGSTGVQGSDGQTLTDDLLLSMVEALNRQKVPRPDRTLIVDASGLTDMLKIDKFIAAEYGKTGAVASGLIGTSPLYGCKVRITQNLTNATTGSYGVLMHKKAIVGVAQIHKSWVKKFEELHNIRFQSEALWGVAEHMDLWGIPFYTRAK
jgi:hypothetical protein